MAGGRPTSYDAESFCKTAHEMMQAGATDREVAEALGIAEKTLYAYKHLHPEFLQALKLGKEAADDRVELSLYRRATGYSYDTIKIMQHEGEIIVKPYVEHVPPDTGAAKMWLTNRRGEQWREKVDVNNTINLADKLKPEELKQLNDVLAAIGVGGAPEGVESGDTTEA